MNIWTYLHFGVFLVYVILLIYTVAKNPRAFLNIMAAMLFACFAVWSLGNAMLYNTNITVEQAKTILDWESVGWIFFPVFLLAFVLEFTGCGRAARSPYLWIPLLCTAFLIQIMLWQGRILNCCAEVEHGLTSEWLDSVWLYIYYIYNMGAVIAAIVLLAYERNREKDHNRKRLFEIHLITVVICFVFASALSIVLKEMKIYVPFEGTIILLVFAFGIVYSMSKYEFMLITPSRAAERLINTMKDGFMLLGRDGHLITVNKEILDIFKCAEEEMA
ncbi:MAG TPA: hypothetical protein ENN55_01250, partial [Firmicutes bacterium]|nr:hypothetical protein [Bacillota bacterium]